MLEKSYEMGHQYMVPVSIPEVEWLNHAQGAVEHYMIGTVSKVVVAKSPAGEIEIVLDLRLTYMARCTKEKASQSWPKVDIIEFEEGQKGGTITVYATSAMELMTAIENKIGGY